MSNEIVRREERGGVKAGYTMPVDPVTGVSVDVFPQNYGPKERSIVMAVCERYGLDPIAREVEILHGQIYVTAKGINRIATQDPAFNGVTVEIIEQDWKKGWFVVKAQAWRKGCDHPVEEYADSDGSKMRGGNKFRHTVTRAKARAMRAAFAIPFVAREELADRDLPPQQVHHHHPAPAQQLPAPGSHPSPEWTKANNNMRRIMSENGFGDNEIHPVYRRFWQVDSSKLLNAKHLNKISEALSGTWTDDDDNALRQVAELLSHVEGEVSDETHAELLSMMVNPRQVIELGRVLSTRDAGGEG